MRSQRCQKNSGRWQSDNLNSIWCITQGRIKLRQFAYLISLWFVVAATGCAMNSSTAQSSDRAPAQIGIVNHTGSYIYSASVDGAGGGGMSRWGAGIANICCTSIPNLWHPGMTVVVRWNMPIGTQDVIKEKIVEVEKYDSPGSIYMHFFPNDEVRVVVSRVGPRNPEHPIRYSDHSSEQPLSD